MELFRGIPLFPGNCEYNQLRLIVELLGLPPKDILEMARNKDKYFAPVFEKSGEYTYRFKTVEEYQNEQGVLVPYLNFQETLTSLEDLVLFQNGKNDKNETKECFVDFLKGILHLNPRKRWTPAMASQHPFISRKKYEGPFKPIAEITKRPSLQKKRESSAGSRANDSSFISEEDNRNDSQSPGAKDNSDSSSVSRVNNKSDEMYDKLGS